MIHNEMSPAVCVWHSRRREALAFCPVVRLSCADFLALGPHVWLQVRFNFTVDAQGQELRTNCSIKPEPDVLMFKCVCVCVCVCGLGGVFHPVQRWKFNAQQKLRCHVKETVSLLTRFSVFMVYEDAAETTSPDGLKASPCDLLIDTFFSVFMVYEDMAETTSPDGLKASPCVFLHVSQVETFPQRKVKVISHMNLKLLK